jgi:adenylosuccinate synthase
VSFIFYEDTMLNVDEKVNDISTYNKTTAIQNLTKETLEDQIFARWPVVVIFGGQLGDEGKWKVTTLFKNVDYVACATGWGNAWHTVICNGKSISLHELPGGAIIEKAKVYLGQWRQINISGPKEWENAGSSGLIKEIKQLENNWVNMKEKIVIAGNAQVVFDELQVALDKNIEELKGDKKVWSTKQWIGTSVALKALRTWLNVNMLMNSSIDQIRAFVEINTKLFNGLDIEKLMEEIVIEKTALQNLIDEGYVRIDATNMELNTAAHQNKRILVEASQSAMLSADGWMYPYNTANDTSVNGILSWLNLPEISTSIMTIKWIKSKVGSWFFPTRFTDKALEDDIRNETGEFGGTTGRPRLLWDTDAVELRKALRTNHTDILFITKADLLHLLWDKAKIGESYTDPVTGKVYEHEIPTSEEIYNRIQVNYSKTFDLRESIKWITDQGELPKEYREYFDYLLSVLDNFQGNVFLWTGPWPDEYIIYK